MRIAEPVIGYWVVCCYGNYEEDVDYYIPGLFGSFEGVDYLAEENLKH